jgi:hypothetical protein
MDAERLRLQEPIRGRQVLRRHHLTLHRQRVVLPKGTLVDLSLLGTTLDHAFVDTPPFDDRRDRLQLNSDLPPPALVMITFGVTTDDRLPLLDDGFVKPP